MINKLKISFSAVFGGKATSQQFINVFFLLTLLALFFWVVFIVAK